MEHYIKEIRINRLRHLSNIVITLDPENRQHLMITGKNGSGKTSLLLALQRYLEQVYDIFGNQRTRLDGVNEGGITLFFNEGKDLDCLYQDGRLIIALFPANRSMQVVRAHGVEEVMLEKVYDTEGIVLIDELETHLHIELQKKILPFLTQFFPRIQFIITTHSPYILNSVANAKAYDLEQCVELENLTVYSSDGLAEGYFGADKYADELKVKLERYRYLAGKTEATEEERAERAKLRMQLKNIPKGLSSEARNKFEEIEGKRR